MEILKLTQNEKDILEMRDGKNWSFKRIAQVRNTSPQSVHKIYHNAKRKQNGEVLIGKRGKRASDAEKLYEHMFGILNSLEAEKGEQVDWLQAFMALGIVSTDSEDNVQFTQLGIDFLRHVLQEFGGWRRKLIILVGKF